jgi:hypothetical protein
MLTRTVPDIYRAASLHGWDWAVATLNAYDPYRIFTNAFLDTLLPPSAVVSRGDDGVKTRETTEREPNDETALQGNDETAATTDNQREDTPARSAGCGGSPGL